MQLFYSNLSAALTIIIGLQILQIYRWQLAGQTQKKKKILCNGNFLFQTLTKLIVNNNVKPDNSAK